VSWHLGQGLAGGMWHGVCRVAAEAGVGVVVQSGLGWGVGGGVLSCDLGEYVDVLSVAGSSAGVGAGGCVGPWVAGAASSGSAVCDVYR